MMIAKQKKNILLLLTFPPFLFLQIPLPLSLLEHIHDLQEMADIKRRRSLVESVASPPEGDTGEAEEGEREGEREGSSD